MPTMGEYRGTTEFYRVLSECVKTAEHRGVLHYKDVAALMPGVPLSGSHMGQETGAVAGAISTEMHENGHPMLSALIVRTDGTVGDGFFTLAHQLGKLDADPDNMSPDEKEAFWQEELERVYDHWEREYTQG